MKKSIAKLSSLALAATLTGCSKTDDRPNIVMFLIDDMGWAESSIAPCRAGCACKLGIRQLYIVADPQFDYHGYELGANSTYKLRREV